MNRKLKFNHHDLEFLIDMEWWKEADMFSFEPKTRSYRVDTSECRGREVFDIFIEDVASIRRNPGIGIFNDNDEATAKERVVSILKGFKSDAAIPPVEVIRQSGGYVFPYKLVAGAHRFYCSLAAGFTHVPAVEGFDY